MALFCFPLHSSAGWWLSYFLHIGERIKKKYRRHGDGDRNTGPVSFSELVDFVIDPTTARPFDRHWRPMSELCSPCQIGDDFIGHYETFHSDGAYVLNKLGVQSSVARIPSASQYGRHNSTDRVAQMISQLSKRQVAGLRRVYRLDFELFGYQW